MSPPVPKSAGVESLARTLTCASTKASIVPIPVPETTLSVGLICVANMTSKEVLSELGPTQFTARTLMLYVVTCKAAELY